MTKESWRTRRDKDITKFKKDERREGKKRKREGNYWINRFLSEDKKTP